jgi:UMP-CMP kinase
MSAAEGTQNTVIFVLGGPGSGKGTQCEKIVNTFGYVHFSAGDLLRGFVKSGTPEGNKLAEMMQQGQIVPSSVTVNLLKDAMKESGKTKFLIDGFPRNLENRDTFLKVVGHDCSFVLFFDCPEEILEARILNRGEGRADDNIETIRKRFKTYQDQTLPVVEHYRTMDKVKHIKTDISIDQVFEKVSAIFK